MEPSLAAEGRQIEKDLLDDREREREVSEASGDVVLPLSLRPRILADQWKDLGCSHLLFLLRDERAAAKLPSAGCGGRVIEHRPVRLGQDGVLETAVVLAEGRTAVWVAVLPLGNAGPRRSWRRWAFEAAHCGAFGGHRPAEITLKIISRSSWWPSVKSDVELWVDRCWACIRFRRVPQKGMESFIAPSALFPWLQVMLDFEGPSTPASAAGSRYVLTYMRLLCHGCLYEPLRDLSESQVRRAFIRCVCRAGVMPDQIAVYRGPEIWNALMRELASLLGASTRPATAHQAKEQGMVGREHVEFWRLEGMLVHDVLKAFPSEWGEVLPIVDFIRMNSPTSKTGMTSWDDTERCGSTVESGQSH